MELVCLDIETTGFDPNKDRIIEFAAVRFDGSIVIDKFTELTNPGIPIPHIVSTITGIKAADLVGKKPFSDFREELQKFIGDCPIVGHNINFDTAFLKSQGLQLDNKEIDTLELGTTLIPDQDSYSLESLCQKLVISHVKKHRAMADVEANIELLKILLEKITHIKDPVLQNICHYLTKSNWGSRDLFFEELRQRKLQPLLFSAPKLAAKKEKPEEFSPFPQNLTIEDVYAPDGSLEKIFGKKYEIRDSQKRMSKLVFDALEKPHHLLCEAGTGTGKSLGYLLPAAIFALINRKKVIISTYTNNLQDQLSEKDLPLTRQIINSLCEGKNVHPLKSTLLKGRNHYLSLTRLLEFLKKDFFEPPEIVAIIKIFLWLQKTKTGDKTEIEFRGKENHVWQEICCLENGCNHDEQGGNYPCFLLKNRADAKKSQIIITNHSLLLQDCLSDNPILPFSENIIIDEAHNLEEVATKSFSEVFIISELESIVEKGQQILKKFNSVGGKPNLFQKDDNLVRLTQKCMDLLDKFDNGSSIGFGLLGIFLQNYVDSFATYQNDIIIDDQKADSGNWIRAKDSFSSLLICAKDLQTAFHELKTTMENKNCEKSSFDLHIILEKLARIIGTLNRFFNTEDENIIMWGNISRENHPYLKIAPIKVGPHLQKNLFHSKDSVTLTSATLSVSHNFEFIKNQLGLTGSNGENLEEVILPSPFYYSEQCKIVIVDDIPAPAEHGHFNAISNSLKCIIEEKQGRILILLTSKNTITTVYKQLFDWCKNLNINLYAQGVSGGRGKILQNFRNQPEKSVILGLNSFWEGIDLPGDMLTTVIIQKLPFDPPSDPLHMARGNLSENAFMDYAVPRAILRFKQGFGRLIRSTEDSGILAILDSRIATKRYGHTFLESLPEGIPIIHTSQKDLIHHLHHQ